jgi:YggT family protein
LLLAGFIQKFITYLFMALRLALLLRALLSWFNLPPGNPIINLLFDITEPILAPIRRVVPRIGMLDISIIVAFLLLSFIETVLQQALRGL